MPWLLDPTRPNLHWRVLVELVRRPVDSPAVVRARGGANAAAPVAGLLEELLPDGSWGCRNPTWEPTAGPGWRLLKAVRWGADAGDPRLQGAAERLLEEAPGSGGIAPGPPDKPSPWLTARALQALAELGWCRHQRFVEALAWLDEAAPRSAEGGWLGDTSGEELECRVTPVALLSLLTSCGLTNRRELRERAMRSLSKHLTDPDDADFVLGFPNLDRTDAAERFAVMARAGAPWMPEHRPALATLQAMQGEGGRWPSVDGSASRWITLEAAVGVLGFAVEAELPRLFPAKPG